MHIKETIPTYIINLPERKDRLKHILKEYKDRPEFDLEVVEACRHEVGAVGLWNSILKVIDIATEKNEDVIIICEDDHEFTRHYTKDYLFKNLKEAFDKGVDLFLGGIGGCTYAIPVSKNSFWIERFICTQFTILHKDFFPAIKTYQFKLDDTTDGRFSLLTINKMVIFPFISIQKEFGYSDISKDSNRKPVQTIFEITSSFLERIQRVYSFYTGAENE